MSLFNNSCSLCRREHVPLLPCTRPGAVGQAVPKPPSSQKTALGNKGWRSSPTSSRTPLKKSSRNSTRRRRIERSSTPRGVARSIRYSDRHAKATSNFIVRSPGSRDWCTHRSPLLLIVSHRVFSLTRRRGRVIHVLHMWMHYK